QGGGDAHQSIRVLAELWWRAVYSKPAEPPPAD
ncbi:MAG: TetR/AcrR family transcriptional regulator, partial [Conexibacter sp.]|nr:TetR/AcrR family transcriptional regulator [Conexibacter sp.]